MSNKKRLLTGIQASGTLHIGNYFGALKPFADTYQDYESYIMVADLHALTSLKDPALLKENIFNVVKDYVAVGVDPKKTTMFQQSQVQEHTELAWIFECLVTVPFLSQAHAYKDKVAKGLEPNAGLFNYPMLMAADILLYDAEVVPVGEDQRQHIEYAREAGNKFNLAYGETFTSPQEMILKGVGVVPGTDGKKMSKSYKNTIPLFGTKDEIAKAVMSIVTDSSAYVVSTKDFGDNEPHSIDFAQNLHAIHCLFRDEDEVWKLFMQNRTNYKNLKDALIEDIEALVAPMREKRASVTDSDVVAILKDGSDRARAYASNKMSEVHKKVGTLL